MTERFKNIIRIIDQVYPRKLVLLAIIPIFISIFVDFNLVDFRYLLINLIWIPIFSSPSILFKSEWPKKLGGIIFFLMGLIEISHWLIIKGPLTTTSLLVIGNTNSQEAFEFLSLKSSIYLIVLLPYAFLFFYRFKSSGTEIKAKRLTTISILALFILGVFVTENAYHGRFLRKAVPQIVKVGFSFSDQLDFYRDASKSQEPRKVEAVTSFGVKEQCFVLIIGESCNRHHMSLYDAKRETSPKLKARKDLIVFEDVVSGYSNTIGSILAMLSESNLENKKSLKNSIDIFDVFTSAGFKTYWISNQPPYGIWENQVTALAQKADVNKFLNLSSNSSMEATLTASFDERLFQPFSEALNEESPKKLIILHLMGSHTSYKKRYPKAFDHFSYDNSREKVIAQYDNSVLYNDYVVDSLLNILSEYSRLKSQSVNSAIYLSDHGENVYDEMDKLGHDFSGILPKANVDIPFVVWLSESFNNQTTFSNSELEKRGNLPFVSDDLFHVILDINGIKTPILENERSLLEAPYNSMRNRILVNGVDYDSISINE